MIGYTCLCGRAYKHAAEIIKAGGFTRHDWLDRMVFVCPCGIWIPEIDLWITNPEFREDITA